MPHEVFIDPPKHRRTLEDKIFYLMFFSSTGISFEVKPCYDTTFVEVSQYDLENPV